MDFKVVEKFISINGEGPLAGQLAIFIRFAGCNLSCSYCDTKWANEPNVTYDLMSSREIYEYIKTTEVRNVTLTGGEPLLQEGIIELLDILGMDSEINVEIETNGTVPLAKFQNLRNIPSFTMDYKLPFSRMEAKMYIDNFNYLTKRDTLKFVSASLEDLKKAKALIDEYKLSNKTRVYISPVFGKIELNSIVQFMKVNKMNNVNLQVQLHKIIWEPTERGV